MCPCAMLWAQVGATFSLTWRGFRALSGLKLGHFLGTMECARASGTTAFARHQANVLRRRLNCQRTASSYQWLVAEFLLGCGGRELRVSDCMIYDTCTYVKYSSTPCTKF